MSVTVVRLYVAEMSVRAAIGLEDSETECEYSCKGKLISI